MGRSITALVALLLGLCALAPAVAQLTVDGRTPGGAFYRIVVPEPWNRKLVIWNHGFDLGPVGPVDDVGPLAVVQLAEGFAVAASSYRDSGWAVFRTSHDLELLVDAFTARLGAPDEVILYGASLGGIVTAAAIEQADLGNLTGAMTFCGAMAGSRNWDGALDLRLLYDAVCAKIPAAAIPGGGQGLPKGSALRPGEVETRVNACTGVDLPPGQRTKRQKRNLRKLLKLSGLPEEFLQTDMWYVTFGLGDLTHDRQKMKSRQGIGNQDVDYGNRKINRTIERVKPRRNPARRLERNFTPKGRVGDVKILSIHTDKDGLVIVENQHEYARVVPEENLTVAVAVEDEPSHCGFSASEVVAAWEALLEWLDTGVQTTAAGLQQLCGEVRPIFGGECRFDPAFRIPSMDARVRPR